MRPYLTPTLLLSPPSEPSFPAARTRARLAGPRVRRPPALLITRPRKPVVLHAIDLAALLRAWAQHYNLPGGMQRSDVFQILDEHIEDFQTPAVDERITRWIGGLHGIPSPHPPSSLADAGPPYRHRLRPRPRPPLATIQASTQQQPVNRKRKRNPLDTASKNPEGKDTGKAKSFPEDMMEERAAPVQNSGRTTRSQTAVPQNLSSLPAGNPRRPGNANGLDVGSTVNIQGHSGALDHVPDLNIVPRPAKAASHPNRPQSRSTASKSKTSGGSQSSSVLSSRLNPSMDGSQNSTSSRVVTSKESLALMSPPVLFVPLGCINEPGMKLPSEAQTLWWDYVRPAIASSSYIPNTLKVRSALHLCDQSWLTLFPV